MAKLNVSAAPHIRGPHSTRKIMIDVLIALLPATFWAIWIFGHRALILCVIGVLGAELIELLIMRVFRKRKNFVSDGSAAVTGLLLALNVSSTLPWYLMVLGLVFALGVGKHVFGGLGHNPFNPALVGRVFLMISFPIDMTRFEVPRSWALGSLATAASPVEWNGLMTAATPLGMLNANGFNAASHYFSYSDLFLGNIGGSLGEISALMLLIGCAYLVIRMRIKLLVPLAYILSVLLISAIFFGVDAKQFGSPLFHLLSGGLMLGALYMATDMVTSPTSMKGQVIFGVGCGIFTVIIRYFSGMPEGVSYSILIMNAFKPIIDRYTRPRMLGQPKKRVKEVTGNG